MIQKTLKIIIFLFLQLGSMLVFSLDLKQYLSEISTANKLIQSVSKKDEAASEKRLAGDMNLNPIFNFCYINMDDMKPSASMPYYMINQTKGNTYCAGLSKQFSTGTQLSLNATLNDLQLKATDRIASPGNSVITNSKVGTGNLNISLSQSLWKDFFGQATSLRHQREAYIEKLEKSANGLEARQVLIDAENSFWDYLYADEDVKQKKESLERANKILNWVQKRVSNGIGDQADLLNAQGLQAARKLALLQSSDELVAIKKKIMVLLEITDESQFPNLEGKLNSIRKIESFVEGDGSQILRLDSYLSALEAKAKKIGSQEVQEALKPDLILTGSYGTNSFDTATGVSAAADKLTDTSMPTSQIGIKFIWMIDTDTKRAQKNQSLKEAMAAELKKEHQLIEGQSSWNELNRRHAEMTKKIEAADLMMKIQRQKALVEQDKLTKGRTVTSQVITAEQDAAEAELTLIKLMTEQRKIESQARIFVKVQELP